MALSDPTGSMITNRTPVKLPLSVLIGLLIAVAGAAYAFHQSLTNAVSAQLVPYVPRSEWVERSDREEREREREFWVLKNEITRIETILRRH